MAADRAGADPDDFARGAKLVHPGRRVRAHPTGEDVALPHLRRQRERLERDQGLAQAVDPRSRGGMAVDVLPRREEASECTVVDRFDLPAQRLQRRPAYAAQNLRITPLALA